MEKPQVTAILDLVEREMVFVLDPEITSDSLSDFEDLSDLMFRVGDLSAVQGGSWNDDRCAWVIPLTEDQHPVARGAGRLPMFMGMLLDQHPDVRTRLVIITPEQ
ncbi:hypothetical protein [Streptomyces sp. NPDC088925]|uniref:hypothetical protein n=1 Tax=Streptomyces sp. NPDC088925 TaxID=3365914 RepID=UPI0038069BC4